MTPTGRPCAYREVEQSDNRGRTLGPHIWIEEVVGMSEVRAFDIGIIEGSARERWAYLQFSREKLIQIHEAITAILKETE